MGSPSRKALKILYLNAQSIVKKIDELACVAGNLAPDIILITESWCNSEITDAFLLFNGYELQTELRLDRQDTTQGRGGGLLVYVRDGVKILAWDRNRSFQQYCKFLAGDVTLYLIYRSPNAPAQSLLDLEQLIRGVEKNSLFIGDFNMPDMTGRPDTARREQGPLLKRWRTP